MSSRIDSQNTVNQVTVVRHQRRRGKPQAPKKPEMKANRDVSGGFKAGAQAALGDSADLKKISDSRKPSRPVDEMAGIKDLNAHYYIHTGADRQVVQLREENTSRLVRQVPDQEALERLTSMRRFVGKILDVLV